MWPLKKHLRRVCLRGGTGFKCLIEGLLLLLAINHILIENHISTKYISNSKRPIIKIFIVSNLLFRLSNHQIGPMCYSTQSAF